MVNEIYPTELQFNKTNASDTEASFLDLHISFSDAFVSSKLEKRDEFDFNIVNFSLLTEITSDQYLMLSTKHGFIHLTQEKCRHQMTFWNRYLTSIPSYTTA